VAGLTGVERFGTNRQRVTGYAELKPILDQVLSTRTRAQWLRDLTTAQLPCGSVRDIKEVFSDPQVTARSMIAELEHATAGPVKVVGSPLKFSETPCEVRMPPPTLGQHTEAVLTRDLGLSGAEVAELRAAGVV
jgi:formyl-CoA transferase